ncbi:MAG: hypothetical protein R3B41_02750 [Candidatus Doudnabacteria bacterium]
MMSTKHQNPVTENVGAGTSCEAKIVKVLLYSSYERPGNQVNELDFAKYDFHERLEIFPIEGEDFDRSVKEIVHGIFYLKHLSDEDINILISTNSYYEEGSSCYCHSELQVLLLDCYYVNGELFIPWKYIQSCR